MEYSKALSQKTLEKLQLREALAAIGAAALIPYLVHLLPSFGGIPSGARLLAMFIAPFIAAAFFRYHVAVITAVTAPVFNHFLTGMPAAPVVPILTIELLLFSHMVRILQNNKYLRSVNAPVSYLAVKAVSSLLLLQFPLLLPGADSLAFFTTSVVNALPGLLLLLVLSLLSVRMNKNN